MTGGEGKGATEAIEEEGGISWVGRRLKFGKEEKGTVLPEKASMTGNLQQVYSDGRRSQNIFNEGIWA